jgi:2-oxoglutarate ferredoxin oxidoreductase subunit beta
MRFGKENEKGIALSGLDPQVVRADAGQNLLVHNESTPEPTLAYLLSRMRYPDFPEPLGVFRAVDHEAYNEMVRAQNDQAIATRGQGELQSLLTGDETWTVG